MYSPYNVRVLVSFTVKFDTTPGHQHAPRRCTFHFRHVDGNDCSCEETFSDSLEINY